MTRQRHERVNRSLVGQHVALSPNEDAQILNNIALRNGISGTGEVAGEVTMSEMSASALAAFSSVGNPQMNSPRNRRAANDGKSGRIRRYNAKFGIRPGASLHPSIDSFCSIHVKITERR